jgi:hypothetical protein
MRDEDTEGAFSPVLVVIPARFHGDASASATARSAALSAGGASGQPRNRGATKRSSSHRFDQIFQSRSDPSQGGQIRVVKVKAAKGVKARQMRAKGVTAPVPIRRYRGALAHTRPRLQTRSRTHMQSPAHARTHARTHARIHARTNTRTHARTLSLSLSLTHTYTHRSGSPSSATSSTTARNRRSGPPIRRRPTAAAEAAAALTATRRRGGRRRSRR